jgi:2,3-bisphosphoglycerate-independent phosphoglycerate mutase
MKPVCLIVMDGWGVNPEREGNATALADTPVLDALNERYPHTELKCSGDSVGLPDGQMGNSEVGHMTMGAGRVIFQDLTMINRAVLDGSFTANKVLREALEGALESGGAFHVMGLLSDGGVHSHNTHLYAVLKAARECGLTDIYIHAFLDGRDTPPRSGLKYIEELTEQISKIGVGEIATVTGRYYAMDRDTRWDRVESAYKAISQSEGLSAASPEEAVKGAYARGENDEFVKPTVIDGGKKILDGDTVFFFNFRADRAREITRAFVLEDFSDFDVTNRPALKSFITMTGYDKELSLPVLFPKETPDNILAQILSQNSVAQFRVSETEKYAHVTFFFNGGIDKPFALEERELIDSDREVATYDESPRMRAIEIAEAAASKIREGEVGFVLMNFANGDMVGHSGVLDAAVRGCEAVDQAVGIVVEAARAKGFATLITSDHGNSEEMIDYSNNEVITAHSTNLVPFILVDDDFAEISIREGAGLKDIAPTILKIMGIELPGEMDGEPLV